MCTEIAECSKQRCTRISEYTEKGNIIEVTGEGDIGESTEKGDIAGVEGGDIIEYTEKGDIARVAGEVDIVVSTAKGDIGGVIETEDIVEFTEGDTVGNIVKGTGDEGKTRSSVGVKKVKGIMVDDENMWEGGESAFEKVSDNGAEKGIRK